MPPEMLGGHQRWHAGISHAVCTHPPSIGDGITADYNLFCRHYGKVWTLRKLKGSRKYALPRRSQMWVMATSSTPVGFESPSNVLLAHEANARNALLRSTSAATDAPQV